MSHNNQKLVSRIYEKNARLRVNLPGIGDTVIK